MRGPAAGFIGFSWLRRGDKHEVVEAPYRRPEVPSGVLAERRLDARMDELVAAGAAKRAREHTRAKRVRVALVWACVLSALWLVLAVVLLAAFGVDSRWLGASALASGIALPLSLIFALGAKIPPRPEDAAPVVSGPRVG